MSLRETRGLIKAASNTFKSLKRLKSDLKLNVCRSTICRCLKVAGQLKHSKPISAPKLLPRHKAARLQFVRANMSRDWSKVIFSDEKKFNLDGPDGTQYYWRDMRKEPKYFSKRNFGGGSLMVWGAFCSAGTLTLAFPSTKMNSVEYIGVLENHLLPFLYINQDENWIFQQDNAPVHTRRSTNSWFETHCIPVLDWPACSPDQNPIENLWGILVRKIYEGNRQFDTVEELKVAIQHAWEEISPEIIHSLVRSMPNRILAIAENKGGPTKY